MVINRTLLTLVSVLGVGVTTSSTANFLNVDYSNNSDHFADNHGPNIFMSNWQVEDSDIYLNGELIYLNSHSSIAFKRSSQGMDYMVYTFIPRFNYPTSPPWVTSDSFVGTNVLETYSLSTDSVRYDWTLRPDDLFVTGNFIAEDRPVSYIEELFIVNPSGEHMTINSPGSRSVVGWQRHQYHTSNAGIDHGDKLLVGNFDGDNEGIDEILVIKPSGSHAILSFNQQQKNWEVLYSSHSGSIKWWNINTASDQYLVGDYNGDGKDDLVAINPNGWHHTMSFNNQQWDYIQGGNPTTPNFGNWSKTVSGNRYLSSDINADGKDEIIALNPQTGWSRVLSLNTNGYPQWQSIKSNHGSGTLSSTWAMDQDDHYVVLGSRAQQVIKVLNKNGNIQVLKW